MFKTSIALVFGLLVCGSSTLGLVLPQGDTAGGITPWGRPRLPLPGPQVGNKDSDCGCVSSCSLTSGNANDISQPCSPGDTSPTGHGDTLDLHLDNNLPPDLHTTALILAHDGIPIPDLETLRELTETLNLLRGLGIRVPEPPQEGDSPNPPSDSAAADPEGVFSLDGWSNEEM